MSEEEKDQPYDIIVYFPNGEKKKQRYTYQDMNSAEQAIGALAMAGVRSRDGVRRVFEMVPAPEPEKQETPEDVKRADEPSVQADTDGDGGSPGGGTDDSVLHQEGPPEG